MKNDTHNLCAYIYYYFLLLIKILQSLTAILSSFFFHFCEIRFIPFERAYFERKTKKNRLPLNYLNSTLIPTLLVHLEFNQSQV